MKTLFIILLFNTSLLVTPDIQPFGTGVSLHKNDAMDTRHKQFFQANPKVLLLHWPKNTKLIEIYRKHEKIETFDLSKPEDVKKAETKYGPLPSRTGSTGG